MALEISYNTGDDSQFELRGGTWAAQIFTTIDAIQITSVKIKLRWYNGSGNTKLEIRTVDENGKPTDNILGTKIVSIPTKTWGEQFWEEYTFSSPILLDAGTQYCIVFQPYAPNEIYWRYDNTPPTYVGGHRCTTTNYGATWFVDSNDTAFMFEIYADAPSTPTINLASPTNEDTDIAINTNFQINISAGSAQKVRLYLDGDLEQEFEVDNWSGLNWLNLTNDLTTDTEYSWYVKVQDYNDPYGWHQSDETWTFTTGTDEDPPGKAQNPTPEHEEENIQIVGRNTLKTLQWEAPD